MKTLKELQRQFLSHTYYKGIQTCKNPMDLWVYQEIISEVKPDYIIEIGTWKGGSALWLAEHSNAKVISIDITLNVDIENFPKQNPRQICFVTGSSQDYFESIKKETNFWQEITQKLQKVLVIEDSSHTYENTLECLRLYSPLVSVGSYYIVEDTIAPQLGYDLRPDLAVKEFLKDNDSFIVDETREKYITWNPGGFLKRVK